MLDCCKSVVVESVTTSIYVSPHSSYGPESQPVSTIKVNETHPASGQVGILSYGRWWGLLLKHLIDSMKPTRPKFRWGFFHVEVN